MPDRPTPADALAAAVRDRLAAGGEVRLDGLGTLRRTHTPARVETRDDGGRVLHPPRNDVRFDADDAGAGAGPAPDR